MLSNCCGVFRLRAHSIRTEVSFEIKLGKGIEPDTAGAGGFIDFDRQFELVYLTPCVIFLRKITHKSNRHGVLDPSAT